MWYTIKRTYEFGIVGHVDEEGILAEVDHDEGVTEVPLPSRRLARDARLTIDQKGLVTQFLESPTQQPVQFEAPTAPVSGHYFVVNPLSKRYLLI